jgi:dihydropteroate synthase
MGIVNVTPDSFSDGGQFDSTRAAVQHARRLVDEGADIIDLGGESTRPGAAPVSLDEERCRVLPVLEGLASLSVPISIDTQKPLLMREAIAAGAAMINDVNALLAPGAVEVVAGSNAAACVMHRRGTPDTMQNDPRYDDVAGEVIAFLKGRVADLMAAGLAAERIVVDPGFGFGKTLAHNLELLRQLRQFCGLGVAVMAGVSRKSMLGRITGRAPADRLAASVAAALIAAQNGAGILRVHDVAATRDALAVLKSVTSEG